MILITKRSVVALLGVCHRRVQILQLREKWRDADAARYQNMLARDLVEREEVHRVCDFKLRADAATCSHPVHGRSRRAAQLR